MISAFRPDYTLRENVLRTNFLKRQIKRLGLSFNMAIGCYVGARELSLSVDVEPINVESVMTLANFLEQESIMIDTKEGEVFLMYCKNNRPESIGDHFIEVDKSKALSSDNYSIISGRYYIVA